MLCKSNTYYTISQLYVYKNCTECTLNGDRRDPLVASETWEPYRGCAWRH